LFTRRDALARVGLFDERFFLYYEDNDLCRRFWENGYRVVYHPGAKMLHYHRRMSADGGLFDQLTSKFTWIHIHSFIKYWKKYRKSSNPRLSFQNNNQKSDVRIAST
ncbi:MAG: glycosyltransferase, partial [Candidatus Uhrbacteria bacterium]|nr:glycosyltransferase [Candidatus Uhrbacteria bacterium]